MGVLDWLSGLLPSPAQVAHEIRGLRLRHRGEPLEGAYEELAAGGLAPGKAALLRACVRTLERE